MDRSYGGAGSRALLILLWRADHRLVISLAVLAVVLGVLGNAIVLASGMFIGSVPEVVGNGLDTPAGHRALLALGLVGLGFAAVGLAMALARLLTELLSTSYVQVVADAVGRACLAPRGIAELEDPEVAGDLGGLDDFERSGLHMQTVVSLRMMISRRIGGITAAAILFTFAWWAPLVLAAGWYVANRGSSRWMERGFTVARAEGGDRLRRAEYVRELAVGPRAAKELRVFGLAPWIGSEYARSWLAAMAAVWAARRANLRELASGVAAVAVSHAAVFGLLGWHAVDHSVSIGQLTVYGMAVLGTAELGFLGNPQWRTARAAALARQVLDLEARLGGDARPAPGTGPAAGAGGPATSGPVDLDLAGVRFAYRDGAPPVLDGLDLRVPPGQSLAVVGENGAGKTTLIKLVCGLYEPGAGRISVDGQELRTADVGRVRRRIGVIFQDFVRYELSLRENIGFGSLSSLSDVAEVGDHGDRGVPDLLATALRDAGGEDVLAGLPDGWATVLAGGYPGGVDLSGGQWQKVALARALAAVHGGAGLLILDEPTANLDVRAEAELFDRFLTLTRGVTTILVSHRLSSVRHADRIVVLEGGRVVEDGSHAELMAAGGRYARMFRLQAHRFGEPESGVAGHA